MRIAFIIAYHGAWPELMRRAFLPSAARNADIADFYIFSSIDADVPYSNIYNVNVGNLSERSALYSERLGFDVTIHNGYKLNDFRPLDYDIFHGDLRGNYTHWGWIDTDTLLGCFSCTLGKLPFATVTIVPAVTFKLPTTSGGLTIVEIHDPPVNLARHIDPRNLSHAKAYSLDELQCVADVQRVCNKTELDARDAYLMHNNITFASYPTLRVQGGSDWADRNFSWPRWPIDARGNIRRIVYDETYLAYNTWWPKGSLLRSHQSPHGVSEAYSGDFGGDKVIPVDIRSVAFAHFQYEKQKPLHISDPDQWRLLQYTRGGTERCGSGRTSRRSTTACQTVSTSLSTDSHRERPCAVYPRSRQLH